MSVGTWDEIRTAYHVALRGTVSGAAEDLGVHHATVIRHVDALESRMGVKLFQRHPRGYTPTEAGRDLLQVAKATDDQFRELAGRIKGQGEGVTGELVVTSLTSAAPRLTRTLVRFREAWPDVTIRYITSERLLRLEYGEAHVALRAGAAPEEPDNVVQPLVQIRTSLYASAEYVAAHGRPETLDDLGRHHIVGIEGESRAPFQIWLADALPPECIVFRATDPRVVRDAVLAGAGIGFVTDWEAERFPQLVKLFSEDTWLAPLWIVTHVDLHRTAKVQAFLAMLKEDAAAW